MSPILLEPMLKLLKQFVKATRLSLTALWAKNPSFCFFSPICKISPLIKGTPLPRTLPFYTCFNTWDLARDMFSFCYAADF